MTGGELRALREATGLSQDKGAAALGLKPYEYALMERGQRDVSDDVAERARSRFGSMQPVGDAVGSARELRLALGEATMMLGPDQRAELTRVVGNALVDDAVARAVMARVGSTLADEVARKDAELRAARDELVRVRAVVSEGRR